MTDNEVIKALKCCNGYNCETCKGLKCCDYMHPAALTTAALNIIKQQKAEIERLEKDKCSKIVKCIATDMEKAKSEAIKEFAERLKEKYKCHILCSFNVINNEIDNLVKEMTEVQE